MNESSVDQSDLLRFSGAMFLMFLGLRIAGVINWPWYWLSAPMWGKAILTGIATLKKEKE